MKRNESRHGANHRYYILNRSVFLHSTAAGNFSPLLLTVVLLCAVLTSAALAVQQSIDISYPLGSQQQTRRMLLQRSIDGTCGRTDGRTPYHFIDPVALTRPVVCRVSARRRRCLAVTWTRWRCSQTAPVTGTASISSPSLTVPSTSPGFRSTTRSASWFTSRKRTRVESSTSPGRRVTSNWHSTSTAESGISWVRNRGYVYGHVFTAFDTVG